MPFGSTSLSRLAGANPVLVARITELERRFNAIGGDLTVPDYGGFRTYDQQAQLVAWRDQAVADGKPFYAVAPAGSSKHETGDAGDVHVIHPANGMTVDQSYQWLANEAPAVGLVAGYYFGGGPPSKKSDPFHFELPLDWSNVQLPFDIGPGGNPIAEAENAVATDDGSGSAPAGAANGVVVVALAVIGLVGVILWKRGNF